MHVGIHLVRHSIISYYIIGQLQLLANFDPGSEIGKEREEKEGKEKREVCLML